MTTEPTLESLARDLRAAKTAVREAEQARDTLGMELNNAELRVSSARARVMDLKGQILYLAECPNTPS